MNTFQEITLKGNVPTKAGELAMELVYEALTGKCWHVWDYNDRPYICKHGCGTKWHNGIDISHAYSKAHPALLTSLDAWVSLSDIPLLTRIMIDFITKHERIPETWEILREALRTLEGACGECEGTIENWQCKGKSCPHWHDASIGVYAWEYCSHPDLEYKNQYIHRLSNCNFVQSCTCHKGKVPLYKIWEGRI